MGSEPGPGLARRRMLALLALTLPAGCATIRRTAAVPGLSGPGASSLSSPSATVPAQPSPSVGPSPGASSAAGVKPSRGGPVPFEAGRVMLGSYLALGGMSLPQSLALRRRQLGRDQRIVHRFYPWDGPIPAAEPDVAPSCILMVSWHGTAYPRITDGSSDRLIGAVAEKLAAMKRPILLRWGWEMNGDWFAWSGAKNGRDTAGYVAAWRRLHRIFEAHGVTNVAWVWSPNWNSAPVASWNDFRRYYPGDDYVDWVGISGYDFYGESPATLFDPVTSAYGSGKPIILSETAAIDLGAHAKARWINGLSTWAAGTPTLGAVVWFDTDIQPDSTLDFRPDSDAEALAAYRAMARSKRFAG